MTKKTDPPATEKTPEVPEVPNEKDFVSPPFFGAPATPAHSLGREIVMLSPLGNFKIPVRKKWLGDKKKPSRVATGTPKDVPPKKDASEEAAGPKIPDAPKTGGRKEKTETAEGGAPRKIAEASKGKFGFPKRNEEFSRGKVVSPEENPGSGKGKARLPKRNEEFFRRTDRFSGNG
ncbi:MAG: hypothetical protein LBF41_09675 [Deltaproteobacteria bacterium]|nr:hypothetical protein [Deltaproteobacteria bacterium]